MLELFDEGCLLDSFLRLLLLLPPIDLSFISQSVVFGSDLNFIVELSIGHNTSFYSCPLFQLIPEDFRSHVDIISFKLLLLYINLSLVLDVCHLVL